MLVNFGYMIVMLFNQNNCVVEVLIVIIKFEVEVGKDLCIMMGYDGDKVMGYFIVGGFVVNIEVIWVGRNVKYFLLGLQEVLLKEEKFVVVRGYKVNIFKGKDFNNF